LIVSEFRSQLAQLLLWDYERGSLPYDIMGLVLLLIVLLAPGGFWSDPMWGMP
jgi:hypothetical protein